LAHQELRITVPSTYIRVGDAFKAQVTALNFSSILLYQIVVAWDPSVLDCTGARDLVTGNPPYETVIDNTRGVAKLVNYYLPAITPPAQLSLVEINFTAKASGTSPISFWLESFDRTLECTLIIDVNSVEVSFIGRNTVVAAGETPTLFRIYGTITDAVTGAAIKCVQVCMDSVAEPRFCPTTKWRAASDPTGYYELWTVAGTYTIAYRHQNYVPANIQYMLTKETIIDIQLCPVLYEGYVLDACTGEGLPNVTVKITVGGKLYSTTTDEKGFFTICSPSGTATITAETTGYCKYEAKIDTFPGTIQRPTIYLRRKATITGRVIDALTGNPIEGARIEISSPTLERYYATTDADGNFIITELCAAPVYYKLLATAPNYHQSEWLFNPCTIQALPPIALAPLNTCYLTYNSWPIQVPATVNGKTLNPGERLLLLIGTTVTISVPKCLTVDTELYAFSYFEYDTARLAEPTLTLTVNRDVTVTAQYFFGHNLTVQSITTEGKTLSRIHFTLDGKDNYTPHTECVIEGWHTIVIDDTATVNGQNYVFVGWAEVAGYTSPSITIEVLASGTLTAIYKLVVTPDFSISASPSTLTIQQGGSATSIITVKSLAGFSQPVNLTVTGQPSGVAATLSPEHVTPPPDGMASSTLTVKVDETAKPGTYTLTVTATSNTTTRSFNITLTITEKPPPPPELATVTGRILSILGPVSEAEISLNDVYKTKSAADGTFTITNVPFGTYTFKAKPTRLLPIPEKLLFKTITKPLTITSPYVPPIILTLPLNYLNIGLMVTAIIPIAYILTRPKPYYY
jgi:hypothetical protein